MWRTRWLETERPSLCTCYGSTSNVDESDDDTCMMSVMREVGNNKAMTMMMSMLIMIMIDDEDDKDDDRDDDGDDDDEDAGSGGKTKLTFC